MEIYYTITANIVHAYLRIASKYTFTHDNACSSRPIQSCRSTCLHYRGKRLINWSCRADNCDCVNANKYIRECTLLELRDIVCHVGTMIGFTYSHTTTTISEYHSALYMEITTAQKAIKCALTRFRDNLAPADREDIQYHINLIPKCDDLLKRYDELEARYKKLIAAPTSAGE